MADLAYGLAPRTMVDRADAFGYKNKTWLEGMPEGRSRVIRAIASQFAKSGTDNLENPHIFRTPEVFHAGGVSALMEMWKEHGNAADALRQAKLRMFTA